MSDHKPPVVRRHMSSLDFFRTPEWLAVLDLLGVQADQRTMGVTVRVGPTPDDPVLVTHTFNGGSIPAHVVDVTTMRTQTWAEAFPKSGKTTVHPAGGLVVLLEVPKGTHLADMMAFAEREANLQSAEVRFVHNGLGYTSKPGQACLRLPETDTPRDAGREICPGGGC